MKIPFEAYHPDDALDNYIIGEFAEAIKERAEKGLKIRTTENGEKVLRGWAEEEKVKEMMKIAELGGGIVVIGEFQE